MFASISCSKKTKNDVNNDKKSKKKINYLCDITPKLINDDGTKDENNIISSTHAKNLLNKSYLNNNFLNEFDQTLKNPTFVKYENNGDHNSKIKDITPSFGEIKVYYLNEKVMTTKKEIIFMINKNMLKEINIKDLNKMIKIQSFDKKLVTNDDKPNLKLFVNNENNCKFSYENENNAEMKLENNEDIKKLKK